MAESNMENTLREILRVLEPLPEHREARWQFLRELQGAVESVETLRGDYSISIFFSLLSFHILSMLWSGQFV